MVGVYSDPQGKKMSVIRTTKKGRTYYEIGEVRGVGYNRLFIEISEEELKQRIKNKEIKLCQ